MVTYINKATRSKYSGLSTDEKPIEVQNGSLFLEIDTGKHYAFDAENGIWVEQPASGGGIVTGEIYWND